MALPAPPRPLQVLLIGDEPAACLLTAAAFEPYTHLAHLHTLREAEEAIGWLQAQAEAQELPDVILLELFMTTGAGASILRLIHDTPSLRHLRVAVLSGSRDPRDVNAAYNEGATCYLVKSTVFAEFEDQMHTFVTYWQGIFNDLTGQDRP
ncbi:hypothetical protein DM785_02780 [Deinococcus actinosclerus]|nr:hypothetical protein DM785_02780 [Deinococcus actinosclerus]